MIPESVAALYAFLGLVTPGLVYQLLREGNRPGLEETTFREASRVALTSAVLTTLSLITLALISLRKPAWFVDAGDWLTDGTAYAAGHPALVAWSMIATVFLACLYAALALALGKLSTALPSWARALLPRRIVRTDVWFQLLVDDVPAGTVPWLLLRMTDGTLIWGHFDFLTVGKALAEREISLKGPNLTVKSANGASKTETLWERIAVRAADVALVKVVYKDLRAPAATRSA